jgi:zinc protease
MPSTTIQIYFRQEKDNNKTYGDFRRSATRALYDIMFIQRIQEISRSKDAPFINAFGRYTDFIGGINVYMLIGVLKENNILGGYETILTEAFRVLKHGFAETEFDRAKSEIRTQYEKRFNEKDKTESSALVREISGYFYENESMPGIELEKALIDKYLKEISLSEVNELAKGYLHKENTVITLSAPEKLVQGLPTEEQLVKVFNNVSNKTVADYYDDIALKPLFNKVVAPGKITEISKVNDIEATIIKLDNGAKVILKPTNFKNDEILFSAISKGGSALASDKDYLSAVLSADIMEISGIEDFKYNQLLKLISGKNVSITSDIDNYTESMRGSSTPEDLETMFQLIYLGFTSPRMDKDAFSNYMDKLKESLRNNNLSPDNAFGDTIDITMSSNHHRSKPLDSSMLSNVDLKTAYEFYKNRFANASDFTFVFVGNIDIEKFKPLIVNYIASLPSAGKSDPIKDMGIKLPVGNINKVFQKGLAPKANVRIIYSGKFNYSEKEAYNLKALVDILRMRITKDLREEKGGIYSPGVFQSIKRLPDGEYQINIDFDCAAADVEILVSAAKAQAEQLKTKIDDEEVGKVKAADKNQIDLNLKSNNYWLSWLNSSSLYNDNLSLIINKSQLIDELKANDLIETASKYLNSKNIVKVVMYPENFEID